MYKSKLFQSSGKKNELHIKFRDENNSLTKKKKNRFWAKLIKRPKIPKIHPTTWNWLKAHIFLYSMDQAHDPYFFYIAKWAHGRCFSYIADWAQGPYFLFNGSRLLALIIFSSLTKMGFPSTISYLHKMGIQVKMPQLQAKSSSLGHKNYMAHT